MAASAVPSQRLHFIDPDKGRVTGIYKVWLD
jgi:viroplasmin and RNaseH domain-containing protein